MPQFTSRIDALSEIMDEAARIAVGARLNLQMELKQDVSIVTNGDREVETFLRTELTRQWPGSRFWGEEFGRDDRDEGPYWLIDPIDGTSNYAYGSPLWGISLALVQGTKIEAGMVWLPDLDERFSAEVGRGAAKNGQALPPIPPGGVKRHELVSYCESIISRSPNQDLPGKMRCMGAFVVDGAFTATQRIRGMIGLNERIYDAAACILICQELGADVGQANGSPLDYPSLLDGRRFEQGWLIFPSGSGFFLKDAP